MHVLIVLEWVCPSDHVKADSKWRPEENMFRPRILSRLQAFITVCEDTDYLPTFCKASKLLLNLLQELWPETNFIGLFPVFNEKYIYMINNENGEQSHEQMINEIITLHFGETLKFIRRIAIGICNEVYDVGLKDNEMIVRLSSFEKYLMGSHDHIPKFKELGIKVPDILFEDYSKTKIPLAYQIQNKIQGKDLGDVIETLTEEQLKILAKEIASIFIKVKTIPASLKYGLIWGGGDNELSDTWTERMRIWIDESIKRGRETGVMDHHTLQMAEELYTHYKSYFDSVKPVTYFGDICSKNVMIDDGKFSGLVDLDGLTQGDPLEAIGRIKLSWYGTKYGEIYTNAIMDQLHLNNKDRKLVTMYALLNQISWMCENGIQFNLNTKPFVDNAKLKKDKELIKLLYVELSSQKD